MNEAQMQELKAALWDSACPPDTQVYWLLDGARDPKILESIRTSGLTHCCLFEGALHPRLQAAAPYLVHLPADSAATSRLLSLGWGKAWGVLTVAPVVLTLAQQRLHLKKLLRVRTEDQAVLAFRYYDPRVMTVYLPTCTADELAIVFGPLQAIIVETDDGSTLRVFDRVDTSLRTRDIALHGFSGAQECKALMAGVHRS